MSAPDLALRQESNLPEEGGGKEQEMKSVPEVNALPDDYPWANFGLRPPVMKEIQIIRRTQIRGVPFNVGDVTKVTEQDALTMIACGVATSYPPLPIKEETPEHLAERRKKALSGGSYKVEITGRCFVKGFECSPGEVISVDEEGALCMAVSGRGNIVGRPPGKESVEEKITRVVEEMLRGASK